MPFTTVAFFEAQTVAAAYVPIAAIADQHLRISGDDIQLPTLSQIALIAGGCSDTAGLPRMRVTSPSLREKGLYEVSPIAVATATVEPNAVHQLIDLRRNPLKLVVGEQLNAEVLSTVTTEEAWLIAWLTDAPIAPITGEVFTVRATGAATLVAGAWTNAALTFSEDLPRGRYQIVGMRAISAGLVAARCVLVGGGWRPGVLGNDGSDDQASDIFRMGNMGIFGEFEDIEPPTIDFLSVSADTAEVVYFDLVQLRKGPA